MMGRPSSFTPQIGAEICERLAEGVPLAVICREDRMPHVSTVWRWREADKAFAQSIARAREVGFDAIAVECLDIADDDARDWEPLKDSEGNITGIKVDGEHVTRAKLKIETRLKLLAKWDPKRYGDMVKLAGADGGAVVLAMQSDDDRI